MNPNDVVALQQLLSYIVPGIVIIALGVPIVRLVARRLEPRKGVEAAELVAISARLERIESAVESVAVEVERISEAQRFASKLQAERLPGGRGPGPGDQDFRARREGGSVTGRVPSAGLQCRTRSKSRMR